MQLILVSLLTILLTDARPTPAEPLPRPREADSDPRRPARQEEFRKDPDPVLCGLARREINAGDAVEPIIRANPHYEVFRVGAYVVLTYDPTGYGGTRVMAKDGKLVGAWFNSCVVHDTFFDVMTDDVRSAGWEAFGREYTTRINGKLTVPAVIGTAAGTTVWRRPKRP